VASDGDNLSGNEIVLIPNSFECSRRNQIRSLGSDFDIAFVSGFVRPPKYVTI